MTCLDRIRLAAGVLLIGTQVGCNTDKVAEMPERSARRQQEQNAVVARQSEAMIQETRRVTEAAKEIVAKDAESRQDLIRAQHELHAQVSAERASVDRQRENLEKERQRIASGRQQAPIVAEAIHSTGVFISCLLPLLVAAYALSRLDCGRAPSEELSELLIAEFTSEQPRLLPGGPLVADGLPSSTEPTTQGMPCLEHSADVEPPPPF
jgi:hypothetical protein